MLHASWLWWFLIQTQCSSSLGVPCTARKRADTLTPWTLTRPVSPYLFFPALLVFSPVSLLSSSWASGAIVLLPTPNSWCLCFPQSTEIFLPLPISKVNPTCFHTPCSNPLLQGQGFSSVLRLSSFLVSELRCWWGHRAGKLPDFNSCTSSPACRKFLQTQLLKSKSLPSPHWFFNAS